MLRVARNNPRPGSPILPRSSLSSSLRRCSSLPVFSCLDPWEIARRPTSSDRPAEQGGDVRVRHGGDIRRLFCVMVRGGARRETCRGVNTFQAGLCCFCALSVYLSASKIMGVPDFSRRALRLNSSSVPSEIFLRLSARRSGPLDEPCRICIWLDPDEIITPNVPSCLCAVDTALLFGTSPLCGAGCHSTTRQRSCSSYGWRCRNTRYHTLNTVLRICK